MNHNNRRSFIKGAAAAGIALAGPTAAMTAHAALADVDRPVANVLASYGLASSVETKGKVARITVDVNGIQPFAESFERFTRLSDCVRVENDNVTFEYGKTSYYIQNRVA